MRCGGGWCVRVAGGAHRIALAYPCCITRAYAVPLWAMSTGWVMRTGWACIVGVGLFVGVGCSTGGVTSPGGDASVSCAIYAGSVQHEAEVFASWKASTPGWQDNTAVVPVVRDAYVAAGDQYRAALAVAPTDLQPTFQALVSAHDVAAAEGGVKNAGAEADAATAVEVACAAAGYPVVRSASA